MPSEGSNENRSSKYAKGKVTAISLSFTGLANKITNPEYRDWLLFFSPALGYFTNLIWEFLSSFCSLWYTSYRAKLYIKELETEKQLTGISVKRKKDIDFEIESYRKAIGKSRMKNINIDF